ncbi:MAG: hypothetical protein QM749_15625 [Aquabacterium sp.]
MSTPAHAADPEAFTFNINATDTDTGEAVKGSVFMYLMPDTQVPALDETLADGTLHRSFALNYFIYISPFYPSSWQLSSGSNAINALTNPDDWTSRFTVDQYLYTNGSSSLSYRTGSGIVVGRSDTENTVLSFKLDCACNNLFTSTITSDTFARYDTISGLGTHGSTSYNDVSQAVTTVDNHIAFATTAVHEPGAVSLMLAGLGLIGARRWSASRKA